MVGRCPFEGAERRRIERHIAARLRGGDAGERALLAGLVVMLGLGGWWCEEWREALAGGRGGEADA